MADPKKIEESVHKIGDEESMDEKIKKIEDRIKKLYSTPEVPIVTREQKKKIAEKDIADFKVAMKNKVAMVEKNPDAKEEDKKNAQEVGVQSVKSAEEGLKTLQQEISELGKQVLEKESEVQIMEEAAVRESVDGGFVNLAEHGHVLSHEQILKEIKEEKKKEAREPDRLFKEHEPVLVMGQNGVLESGWKVLELHDKEITVGKHPASGGAEVKLDIRKIPIEELIDWNPPINISIEKPKEEPKKIDDSTIKKYPGEFPKAEEMKKVDEEFKVFVPESKAKEKPQENLDYVITGFTFEGTPTGLGRALLRLDSQIKNIQSEPEKAKEGKIVFDDFSAFNLGFVNPKNLHELSYALLKLREYMKDRRETLQKEMNSEKISAKGGFASGEKNNVVLTAAKKKEMAELSELMKLPVSVKAAKEWNEASPEKQDWFLDIDKLVNERAILLKKGEKINDAEKARINAIREELDRMGAMKESVKAETETDIKEQANRLEDLISAAEVLGILESRDQLSAPTEIDLRMREMEVLGVEKKYSSEVIRSAAEVYRARLRYAGEYERIVIEAGKDKKKKFSEFKGKDLALQAANLDVLARLKELNMAFEKDERAKLEADPNVPRVDIDRLLKDGTRKGARYEAIMMNHRTYEWQTKTECEINQDHAKRPGLFKRTMYKIANMSPKKRIFFATAVGLIGGGIPGVAAGFVGSLIGVGAQKIINKWAARKREGDVSKFAIQLDKELRKRAKIEHGYYDKIAEKKYEEVSDKNMKIAAQLKEISNIQKKKINKRDTYRKVGGALFSSAIGGAAGFGAAWGSLQLGAEWGGIYGILNGHQTASGASKGYTSIRPRSGNFDIFVAKQNESVWVLLKKDFIANAPGFKDYSPNLQNYIVDAYKDAVVAEPKLFGLTDANIIQPGFGKELGVFFNSPNAYQVYSNTVLKGARVLGMH